MNEIYILLIAAFLLTTISFLLGWYLSNKSGKNKIMSAEERAKQIISNAEKEANNLKKEKLLEVKDEWYRKKQEFDNEVNNKRNKLLAFEKQLNQREENFDKKVELVTKKEQELNQLKKELETKAKLIQNKTQELERLIEEENRKLEKIAGLSTEEAKKILLDNLIQETKNEAAAQLKSIRDQAKQEAKKEAQKIIVQAIQRFAADYTVESTVSVLNIQNDEMKGRIIGREGRNIRAFEASTGVDVIVDDTPEAVILSAFDPIRREVAKIALEKLMSDGRIHPSRIEEVVEKVKNEIEEEIFKVGENALMELGLNNAHPEIIKCIGKMKYRSSYGQNLLAHSLEVAHITGLMAAELGFDITLARRAALLHDIGKTVDKTVDGPHALIGYEFAKKYNEHPVVLNVIGSHHEDMPMETPIAALVQAADAISGARPGARRESVEGYIKRLEKLEALAQSFDGVAKTYAIQAGREIRVIVEPDKIDDARADQLANDIAKKIEQELEYPGQIKITIIREHRATAYAK
ncbi:MAG: Hydrolase (HAD superfamily) [Ignavibacteriae bacterium]|nr:MAG: Hydrolase (HAD superfamily) [Ignavibacteriota bacterium]